MKDIINKNKKLDDCGTVNLSANYSTIIQRRMPQKMQDPGSFTISCAIGNHEFRRDLCDSGASINLIISSVARRLSLGELIPTNLTLRMADISVVKPEGIIEDVCWSRWGNLFSQLILWSSIWNKISMFLYCLEDPFWLLVQLRLM